MLFGSDGGLEALTAVHRQFLDNGADVIGSLTYKLSHEFISNVRDTDVIADFPEGYTVSGSRRTFSPCFGGSENSCGRILGSEYRSRAC